MANMAVTGKTAFMGDCVERDELSKPTSLAAPVHSHARDSALAESCIGPPVV